MIYTDSSGHRLCEDGDCREPKKDNSNNSTVTSTFNFAYKYIVDPMLSKNIYYNEFQSTLRTFKAAEKGETRPVVLTLHYYDKIDDIVEANDKFASLNRSTKIVFYSPDASMKERWKASAHVGLFATKTGLEAYLYYISGKSLFEAVSKPVGNPLDRIVYSDKVKEQMTWNDYHGFPESVDAFGREGILSRLVGGDGKVVTKLEIWGGYKGKEGVFEYIIDGSNHRLFVPK